MRFWIGWFAAAMVGAAWAEDTNEDDSLRQKRLIGNIITSTTTVLTITTVSTEVPVSCLVNVLPTVACMGRRRRRATAAAPPPLEASDDPPAPMPTELHGSLTEDPADDKLTPSSTGDLTKEAEISDQKARIFLFATRFVTVDNVVTWFTTSTNESTTVSFSLACTAAGQNLLTRRCVSP